MAASGDGRIPSSGVIAFSHKQHKGGAMDFGERRGVRPP
jgi:hypothetical protein